MDLWREPVSPTEERPRVINVDGNPAYPTVISELKRTGELGRRCRCRPVRYLNNISRTGPSGSQTTGPSKSGLPGLSLGVANASGYRNDEHDRPRTSEPKNDIAGQAAFVERLFGLTAA